MNNVWKVVDEEPFLAKGDVHIWRTFLDRFPIQKMRKGWKILSPEEQERATRFIRPEHRKRFVISHAALHAILAIYLPGLKWQIRFRYNDYGKPYLKDNSSLQFSFSNSFLVSLCAVAWNQEVGIDIEFIKPDIHVEHIADRFFSLEESQTLKALPYKERLEAFYQIWTLKEAYVKAIGRGLSFSFQGFTIDMMAEKNALLWTEENTEWLTQWLLFPIPSAKGYKAALATKGIIKNIHYFESP